MSKINLNDLTLAQELDAASMAATTGGQSNQYGDGPLAVFKYAHNKPTAISDDGINVLSSDPTRSNLGYDSPFTPIPG
jgi:hypothetical protein